MELKMEYVVHGVATGMEAAKVVYEGEEIDAQVETLAVELVPHDDARHGGGSVTLRLKGRNLSAYRDAFVADKVGTLVWIPGDGYRPGAAAPQIVTEATAEDTTTRTIRDPNLPSDTPAAA